MPQYYRLPTNWGERGKIRITFKPFWRNWPILKSLPIMVGDRVRFRIEIEKPAKMGENPMFSDAIHEIIDGKLLQVSPIPMTDRVVEGLPIPYEGNLRFTLGYSSYPEPGDPLIITANVQNKDRWWVGCAGLLIGAILTVLSGIALGVIQIDKMWRIWNPFAR